MELERCVVEPTAIGHYIIRYDNREAIIKKTAKKFRRKF